MSEPLASILRPTSIDDMVWQAKIISKIKAFIGNEKIPSMIFFWPPGCGKTTLAHIIAKSMNAQFYHLSWVTSKKDDLKEIIEATSHNSFFDINKTNIVFLDEIHRWNKAQQDALLPYVESWQITLIWATTENPSFTINNALISRSKVFVFEKISSIEIEDFFVKNLDKIKKYYPDITIIPENITLIWELSNWDLRNAINVLESVFLIQQTWDISKETILEAYEKTIYYDKNWEEHYNIISAIHKSLRDSDPDAACYWVQRMLASWEDPLYIARRLLRFASEDIGLANNSALMLANQVYDAVSKIGMPESDVFLMHLAIYLAKSPKDNTAYLVSLKTKEDVQKYGNLPVPLVIRNASSKLMKEWWYWNWYKYAHDFKDQKVDNEHFPDELKGRKYV